MLGFQQVKLTDLMLFEDFDLALLELIVLLLLFFIFRNFSFSHSSVLNEDFGE